MINWDLIEELEGFRVGGYVPKDSDGNPLGASGVTVGVGVDLGQWSSAGLSRIGVPDALCAKVERFCGLKGDAAVSVAKQLRLKREEARQLTQIVKAEFITNVSSIYDGSNPVVPFGQLPGAVQTVIMSVAFQYGPGLRTVAPNFWRQATQLELVEMYANLMKFGDKYTTRRRKEAAHLATYCIGLVSQDLRGAS